MAYEILPSLLIAIFNLCIGWGCVLYIRKYTDTRSTFILDQNLEIHKIIGDQSLMTSKELFKLKKRISLLELGAIVSPNLNPHTNRQTKN